MKRSAPAAVRDPSRRAQRIRLLQHDVPTLEATGLTAVAPSAAPRSEPAITDATLQRLIDERLAALLPRMVQAKVDVLGEELRDTVDASLRDESSIELPLNTPVSEQDIHDHEMSSSRLDSGVVSPSSREVSSSSVDMPASPPAPKVRVVSRNPISGAAALSDKSAPSLARKAPAHSTQPALASRCFAHAGQHYLGATEDDVIAAWSAMRERFRLTPENKIVARRSLLDWLQRTRTVCASNIHWYGDFVAVRSCPVRVAETHPGHGVDGWFLLFDPNGDSFLRSQLFAEAYDSPDARHSGVVPQMLRPAWVSEDRRAAAAARHGGEGSRPFSPETADDLTANDFFRGLAE